LGPGFYVLPEFHEDVLREFASQAINQNPGELTVCDVYAKGFRNMREGRVPIGGSFNPLVTLPYTALYDYLTAPITGTRRSLWGYSQIKFNPQTFWAIRIVNCREL
jgi:hypothetical protein